MSWDSAKMLEKAKRLYPAFYESECAPLTASEPGEDVWMRNGGNFILDFGTHLVDMSH